MQKIALQIYVGHDGREAIATDVCEWSLLEKSSRSLSLHRLNEPALRHAGLYRREWQIRNGQRFDVKDGKPFSTAFAFSRFLVPSLMQHSGWALFVDSDFLFRSDVSALFASADPRFAVQVVKHAGLAQKDFGTKMDGQAQQPYFRKNWSSCVLFNCGHASNLRLTPYQVNSMPGQWLHAFSWLEDAEIGELDPSWNHLVGVDAPIDDPKAAHFTLGIPDFPGCEKGPLANEWNRVAQICRNENIRSNRPA